MIEKKVTFKKLKKKGLNISLDIKNVQEWKMITERETIIPKSFSQLFKLGKMIFSQESRRQLSLRSILPERGFIERSFEECGESLYSNFFTGLSNPLLTKSQLGLLESIIDADTPDFEKEFETDHFILKWTNESPNEADNIPDSAIIKETAGYLESAWEKLSQEFGRSPYLPPGRNKLEVIFQDIRGYGLASPADGPIQFDAGQWIKKPGIRKPTSAHELFHKLQYSFGYRTRWTPEGQFQWFSEGTASWAETFVWSQVSRSEKITDLFHNPDLNLYNAGYMSLPFWIFFQVRQQDRPEDNPMVLFFQRYEEIGDEKKSMQRVIEENWTPDYIYGRLDHFFALFSKERKLNAWRNNPDGEMLYKVIKDPCGTDIVPTLNEVEVEIGRGDKYFNKDTVSPLGSDYYHFKFENDTDGGNFKLSVEGNSNGDFSFFLLWEKDAQLVRSYFPFESINTYGFSEIIDLELINGVVLIVSGRGRGGVYSIKASIS